MTITKNIVNSLSHLFNREQKSAHPIMPWYKLDLINNSQLSSQQQGSNGYCNNTIVHSCVKLIASSAAAQSWTAYDGEHIIEGSHAVINRLNNPNPNLSGSSLIESVIAHLLISGNAYLLHVRNGNNLGFIHLLRPDRIRLVVDSNGWPQGYKYRINRGETHYPVNDDGTSDVLHISMFNPYDDHYGTSPLSVAIPAIEMHNAATEWNRNLMQNSARPSGAMIYRDDNSNVLSTEQFDRLKQELAEVYQGAANAGRPLLLEGGLEWMQMSMSPRDMDFVQIKNMAAREIALAFGVPPMMLAIPGDNTYSNYTEANRSLWRQTILPIMHKLADDLSVWLKPFTHESNFRININHDNIEALAAEREKNWRRINDATFLTDNEKRSVLGLPPI